MARKFGQIYAAAAIREALEAREANWFADWEEFAALRGPGRGFAGPSECLAIAGEGPIGPGRPPGGVQNRRRRGQMGPMHPPIPLSRFSRARAEIQSRQRAGGAAAGELGLALLGAMRAV